LQSNVSPHRWLALMKELGIGEHLETFREIHEAYAEPHRRYHTAAHIDACLRELDSVRPLANLACEIEAALWFHDVVYAPNASDNERRSAALAVQFLRSAGVPSKGCGRVHTHVMATSHKVESKDPDSALVVDIDLSILGQEPFIYDRFERQVREEYGSVPAPLYRRERTEVLRSFLKRKSVYSTAEFRERYEVRARINLERAIGQLAQS
jgi:predicted metal-dependent HD superfamily phosphohydrolase